MHLSKRREFGILICEETEKEVPDVVIITVFFSLSEKFFFWQNLKKQKGWNIPLIDNPNEPLLDEVQPSVETDQDRSGGESPLILGKFKDYSELERAYRESERFISQTREELKEARELLKESAIPEETVAFHNDLEAFLQEHALTDRAYEFISYLTENPELLSLDNQSAFTFVKRAITTVPLPYQQYRESLSQMPPAVISGQGGEFYTTPGTKPKTFEEAGDLFLQMVKQ